MNIPISKNKGKLLHENRKLSGAVIMTISYVITCDIGKYIYIYIYIQIRKCQYSVCNVLLCKWIVMSVLCVKIENYNNKKYKIITD